MNFRTPDPSDLPRLGFADVRARLLERHEIALIDLREEDPFAQAHPLWAANLPLSRLELDAWRRIPRRSTLLVLYGEHDGVDLVGIAAMRLRALGYTQLHRLDGGLEGWRTAGGELFRDVNVPSKAFGEWVEHERHTPSLSAEEVQALIEAKARGEADVVIVDARRFDEHRTMCIPGSISVPGAELVLRVPALAPDPATRVVVHCAGRTRSIVGAQSLVNARLPNPVVALRNGTIGWTLAGLALEHGDARSAPMPDASQRAASAKAAQDVARRAGVRWIDHAGLDALATLGRTLYRFDVRAPEEYEAGHLPDFSSAPGGQLVQETDHFAPVRGASIALVDDDGVRAPMTASWLAQMGWNVYVLPPQAAAAMTATGAAPSLAAPAPVVAGVVDITPQELDKALSRRPDGVAVIDVTTSAKHAQRHVPGAWFAIRAQLAQALDAIPPAPLYVLTCGSSRMARFAATDLRALLDARGADAEVAVLAGGNAAWFDAGLPVESGWVRLASAPTDRYRRPYEGTDASAEAMQAYLDWEFGLVAQLKRDGTHGFKLI